MSERLLMQKEGRAKFLSHLDLMRNMQRVFARANVAIKHTSGFNPHPYISFALPLPVGTESQCELMDFELVEDLPLSELPAMLNPRLPEGITVLDAYRSDRKFKHIKWLKLRGVLEYDNGLPDGCIDRLTELFSAETLVIHRKTKRGEGEQDIRPAIRSLVWEAASERELTLAATVSAQEPSLPPAALVSAIEQRLPELKPDFASFRRLEVYDGDGVVFR